MIESSVALERNILVEKETRSVTLMETNNFKRIPYVLGCVCKLKFMVLAASGEGNADSKRTSTESVVLF